MNKMLTVSLIIPCHNEEQAIEGCLEHVAAQDLAPIDVILVDNNCSDNTIKIAKQFPFVSVIHETEQGLIPARKRGFESARGDILARIDADTRIPPDWVRAVREGLSEPGVWGVSGPAKSIVEVHLPFIKSALWSKLYFRFARETFGFDVLWGPNMAIRRNAYSKIKPKLASDSRLFHEDQDISALMHKRGLKIKTLPDLKVSVDGSRSADVRKILEYEQRRRRTLKHHRQAGNIPAAKHTVKNILLLAAMAPVGLFLLADGLVYSIEVWLGLRRQQG